MNEKNILERAKILFKNNNIKFENELYLSGSNNVYAITTQLEPEDYIFDLPHALYKKDTYEIILVKKSEEYGDEKKYKYIDFLLMKKKNYHSIKFLSDIFVAI